MTVDKLRKRVQEIRAIREKRRKAWQHVQRVNPLNKNETGDYRVYPMFGGDPKHGDTVWLSEGGWLGRSWMTTRELEAAKERWIKASYRASGKAFEERLAHEGGWIQCGGCRFFAAFDGDFGLCGNPASSMDGHVTFEHGGCENHSNLSVPREKTL